MSDEFNAQEFMEELRERAQNDGVNTEEQFASLVDDLVDEKMEWGVIHADADTESLRAELRAQWDTIRETL